MNKLPVKNSQKRVASTCALCSVASIALVYIPLNHGEGMGRYAIVLLGIFAVLAFAAVAMMFVHRAKLMGKLLDGSDLLASWRLSPDMVRQYSSHLFETERWKNGKLAIVVSVLLAIVFGFFILFAPDGRLGMFLMLVGLVLVINLFARVMPYYYRYCNMRSSGWVLIGRQSAYVNGRFHSWRMPLSGLEVVKEIHEPFHGLRLRYYYHDRTLRNTEQLDIPLDEGVDVTSIVARLSAIAN